MSLWDLQSRIFFNWSRSSSLAIHRIDLLTSITGVQFEDAWAKRVSGELQGIPVYFIGRDSLIQNKKATGRTQDKADLEALDAAAAS